MTQFRRTVESKVGFLQLTVEGDALTHLDWVDGPGGSDPHPVLDQAEHALRHYFDGSPDLGDLPFAPAGSVFQKAVWDVMLAIPYGDVLTYGEVAERTGGVARAVGGACGANPIPILIPCHRVVAANEKLGGFSGRGGAATKRILLAHEQHFHQKDLFLDLDS